MSGRCKSCNAVLFDDELKAKDTLTGQYIEMCFHCQGIAEDPDNVVDSYDTGSTWSRYEE